MPFAEHRHVVERVLTARPAAYDVPHLFGGLEAFGVLAESSGACHRLLTNPAPDLAPSHPPPPCLR